MGTAPLCGATLTEEDASIILPVDLQSPPPQGCPECWERGHEVIAEITIQTARRAGSGGLSLDTLTSGGLPAGVFTSFTSFSDIRVSGRTIREPRPVNPPYAPTIVTRLPGGTSIPGTEFPFSFRYIRSRRGFEHEPFSYFFGPKKPAPPQYQSVCLPCREKFDPKNEVVVKRYPKGERCRTRQCVLCKRKKGSCRQWLTTDVAKYGRKTQWQHLMSEDAV